MFGNEAKKEKPSKLHFWAGALTDGETLPLSFLSGGTRAANESIKGVLAAEFFGAVVIAIECLSPSDNSHS